MSEPTVSIIVPIYNVERYLRQCLDSIEAQTEQDWECICVDDGSPDACWEILQEYRQKDSRFRIIQQKNQGVSAARNTGLELARGKMIMMADADDWLEPDMMEHMVRGIESMRADLAVCGSFFHKEELDTLPLSHSPCFFPESHHLRLTLCQRKCINVPFSAALVRGMSNPVWNKMFRKEIIDRLHLRFAQDIFFGEDLKFEIEYLTACKNVTLLDIPLYNYRIDRGIIKIEDSSWATRFSQRKIVASINALNELIESPPSYLMGHRKREFYSGLLHLYTAHRRTMQKFLEAMSPAEKKRLFSQAPSRFWRIIQMSSIPILIHLYLIPRFRKLVPGHIVQYSTCFGSERKTD